MAVSDRQYLQIMNEYDQTRRENELLVSARTEAVCEAVPEIASIDRHIARISIEAAKKRIYGDTSLDEEALSREIEYLAGRKRELLAAHDYPPDYLDPVYRCPDCRDTGYIHERPCHCLRARIQEVLLSRSGLDEAARGASFSRFCLDCYDSRTAGGREESPRANMERILESAHDFIRDFDTVPGQNLLIYGSTGVGKTFLSVCIGRALLRQEKEVLYLTAYRLFHIFEEEAFHRSSTDPLSVADLLGCDLLIIDDLGTEMTNAFINAQLFLCVNERILHKKSTIINTNLSPGQISETYSERIFSRILESYRVWQITGEDIRLKNAFRS